MSWVVEMGAWDVCEAVGNVAVAHRSIVPCLSVAEGPLLGPRGQLRFGGFCDGSHGWATIDGASCTLVCVEGDGCAVIHAPRTGLGAQGWV